MGPQDHQNCNEFAHDHQRDLHPQVLLIDAGCEWKCYAADSQYICSCFPGSYLTACPSHSYHARRKWRQIHSRGARYLRARPRDAAGTSLTDSLVDHTYPLFGSFPLRPSSLVFTGTRSSSSATARSCAVSRSWGSSSRQPLQTRALGTPRKPSSRAELVPRFSRTASDTRSAWTYMTSRARASPCRTRRSRAFRSATSRSTRTSGCGSHLRRAWLW